MTDCSIRFKLVWALSCSGKILKSSLLTPVTDIYVKSLLTTQRTPTEWDLDVMASSGGFDPIIETSKGALWWPKCWDILSFNLYHNPFRLGYVLMRKWRHREIKLLAQGHTASEWWRHAGLFLLRKVFCSQCLGKCIWVFLVENKYFSAVMDWHL